MMTTKRVLRALALGAMVLGLALAGGAAAVSGGAGDAGVGSAALTGKALVLDSTVTGGAGSEEATQAAALGLTVDVVDGTTWAGMSASDFAAYRVIILGDNTCTSTPAIAPAEANRDVWGPEVDGNIIVNGTDPVFHSSQGGIDMTNAGVAFAADAPGRTGLYISLSCYYHGTAPSTPVTVLDPFGTFTVTGVGCYDNAHIVATHPALAGMTDASISNWSCSVHEAFDTWPESGAGAFTVLAIARDIGTSYTAPDGSVGTPYILARGEGLAAGDISLTPASSSGAVGTTHTVTALVTSGGSPLAGETVTFTVTAGPHAGTTGTATTDAAGNASFSYTGTATGTDTIQASFVDAGAHTQTSNDATREWTEGGPTHRLTVVTSGPGSVTSSPAGISCPSTCVADLADGTVVDLAATPGSGATFTGWSGDCTGTAGCSVTLDADRTVTATFAGPPPPTGEVEVEGKGTIGIRYPAHFDMDDVQRTRTGVLEGELEFESRSRRLEFESTAILTLDRLHNTAQFTGTGKLNGSRGYTFTVAVVDMNHDPTKPSRFSLEIRDAAGGIVYTTNGLRHVQTGKLEIEDEADGGGSASGAASVTDTES